MFSISVIFTFFLVLIFKNAIIRLGLGVRGIVSRVRYLKQIDRFYMQFIDLKAQQNQILPDGSTLIEDIEKNINDVIKHGKYILGPEVGKLENKLANYVGTKHCIGLSSGTDALLAALMALGINYKDEVITTAFSFFATAETIALVGAKPVFVDIDSSSYNIDYKKIEEAISKRTKAIIAVSLYGQTADLRNINKIAEKYNIPVIEDGAQSFGGTHHNIKSGALSTIGTTSFFPSKPLGGYGDGGACFTDDDELASKIREISLHGQTKRYTHDRIGINGRLDTIQAAILLSKIKIFDKEIKEREKIANRYIKEFNNYGFHETPLIYPENKSVFAQFTIEVKGRDDVINFLSKKNIPTSIHYPSLLPNQKALNQSLNKSNLLGKILKKNNYKSFNLNNALKASKSVLSLPMHPLLKADDQDFIIKTLIESLEIAN